MPKDDYGKEALDRLIRVAEQVQHELDYNVFLLRSSEVSDKPFHQQLLDNVQLVYDCFGLESTIFIEPQVPELDKVLERDLIKITREALINIARHAQATQARVELRIEYDSTIHLEIRDNGRGFQVGEIIKPRTGIKSMREWAEQHGGQLDFEPTTTHGTTVRVTIPLQPKEL
jgi:signal transduction histidine kinase